MFCILPVAALFLHPFLHRGRGQGLNLPQQMCPQSYLLAVPALAAPFPPAEPGLAAKPSNSHFLTGLDYFSGGSGGCLEPGCCLGLSGSQAVIAYDDKKPSCLLYLLGTKSQLVLSSNSD